MKRRAHLWLLALTAWLVGGAPVQADALQSVTLASVPADEDGYPALAAAIHAMPAVPDGAAQTVTARRGVADGIGRDRRTGARPCRARARRHAGEPPPMPMWRRLNLPTADLGEERLSRPHCDALPVGRRCSSPAIATGGCSTAPSRCCAISTAADRRESDRPQVRAAPQAAGCSIIGTISMALSSAAMRGGPLWDWWDAARISRPDVHRLCARANASIGINGAVLNNVGAQPEALSAPYIAKAAALAGIFRPYGIKVYLSVPLHRADAARRAQDGRSARPGRAGLVEGEGGGDLPGDPRFRGASS